MSSVSNDDDQPTAQTPDDDAPTPKRRRPLAAGARAAGDGKTASKKRAAPARAANATRRSADVDDDPAAEPTRGRKSASGTRRASGGASRSRAGGSVKSRKAAAAARALIDDDDDDNLPGLKRLAEAEAAVVKPAARPAKFRFRHKFLVLSFVAIVLLPILGVASYLWMRAADQYASTVGFSVQREDVTTSMDLLGGLSGLTKSSSSDTDILYEFLQSQKLVADLDQELNLRAIWSKPPNDWYFRFDPNGSIEDLVDYWSRMVQVSYDGSTGLIEVRVLAFDPADAQKIAQAIFDHSTDMINGLNDTAREDAIKYSRGDLQTSEEQLKSAREAVTKFRTINQMVDPATAVQSQAGLVGSLQNQLAEAQIDVDLLADSTPANDPRMVQAQRRVEVIQTRIAAERGKVGENTDGQVGEAYANLVADYERLGVEREFAERAYLAAKAAYDSAVSEASHKSRYLAAYILPTFAQVPRFPQRELLLAVAAIFLFLLWAIGSLVAYSLKDRR